VTILARCHLVALTLAFLVSWGGDGQYLSSFVTGSGEPTIEEAEICVTAHVYGNYDAFLSNAPIEEGSFRGWWKMDSTGHHIYFIKGDLQIAGHEFVHALLYNSDITWGDEHFDKEY